MGRRVVLLVVAALAGAAFAVPGAEAACSSAKLRALGWAGSRLLRCEARAAAGKAPVDPSCRAAARALLADGFAAAEAAGGCEGTAGAAAMWRELRWAVSDVRRQLGFQGPPACLAGHLDAARPLLRDLLGALARNARATDRQALDTRVGESEVRFSQRWAALIQAGICPNSHSFPIAQDLFDGRLRRLLGQLGPSCGDGVRAGAEPYDGTDTVDCPGPGGADCRCAPVCGDGLVNQPGEQCDGTTDFFCPGACREDCTCSVGPCGNDVVDGGEECDGTAAETWCSDASLSCGAPSSASACRCCIPRGAWWFREGYFEPPCCDGGTCILFSSTMCGCPLVDCIPPGRPCPRSEGCCTGSCVDHRCQ